VNKNIIFPNTSTW